MTGAWSLVLGIQVLTLVWQALNTPIHLPSSIIITFEMWASYVAQASLKIVSLPQSLGRNHSGLLCLKSPWETGKT